MGDRGEYLFWHAQDDISSQKQEINELRERLYNEFFQPFHMHSKVGVTLFNWRGIIGEQQESSLGPETIKGETTEVHLNEAKRLYCPHIETDDLAWFVSRTYDSGKIIYVLITSFGKDTETRTVWRIVHVGDEKRISCCEVDQNVHVGELGDSFKEFYHYYVHGPFSYKVAGGVKEVCKHSEIHPLTAVRYL